MTDREMGSRAQARWRRVFAGSAAAATGLAALASVQGAKAADLFPAPGFFDRGLTSASSWEEILKTPLVAGDFPHIGFGVRFVPLNLTCLADGKLRPLDSSVPGEGSTARDGGHYSVSVFRALPTSINPLRIFLFNKTFDVPVCPPR